MGRLAVLAAALVLLPAAAACGERSEPTGPTVKLYPVTVTSALDRPLVIRRAPKRIAVLAPGPLQILTSLGASSRVVGMPVDSSGAIELRRLARLHPDLIVADTQASDLQLSRAEQATRAPVYVTPGDSIREVEEAITALGLVAGRPVAARRLVHSIEEQRRLVGRKLTHVPDVTVFFDTGLFTTVGDQSLIGDLIREAHGDNVAGPTPGSEPFELRQLVALNPRVYLTSSDSNTTLRDLRRNPETRKLQAIKMGRFAVIDAGLLEPGPRVGDALVAIARRLHPNALR
jgi:ABC-type Fe3+-hydroxamate transport system substrate-binding protein